MPVFEYMCRQCKHRFECLVLHHSPTPECPACQHQDLEKLISSYAVSSDGTRRASLSGEHKRIAGVRREKVTQEHTHLHEHFEDSRTSGHPEKAGGH